LEARGASFQIMLANFKVVHIHHSLSMLILQKIFYDRYEAYKYCCSIGMSMTMENDVASRLAVMQFMNTDRPSNGAGNHLTYLFIDVLF
jgi:hypothetical protein